VNVERLLIPPLTSWSIESPYGKSVVPEIEILLLVVVLNQSYLYQIAK